MIEDEFSTEITRDMVLQLPSNTPRPRVCIFSAFNDLYAPLAEIARPNWTAYAKRHGYAVRFYPRGFHLDPMHPKSYGDKNRFAWYYDLRGLCEMVVYMDIDTMFTDMEKPLPPMHTGRFLWTYDEGGPQSGFWMAKTDDMTEKQLRYTYEYAANENNVRHGKIEPFGISDQDAMTRLMNIPPWSGMFQGCTSAAALGFRHVKDWKQGDWAVHFGGLTYVEKIAFMKEFAHVVPA